MAVVYSFVDALPPKSPVIDLPSAMVYTFHAKSVYNSALIEASPTYGKRRILDLVGVLVETHVPEPPLSCLPCADGNNSPEHHEGRQEKRRRVREALAYISSQRQ